MVGKAEADYVEVSSGLNLGVRAHKTNADKQEIGWWGRGPYKSSSGAAKSQRKVEVRLLALKGMLEGLEGPKAGAPPSLFQASLDAAGAPTTTATLEQSKTSASISFTGNKDTVQRL